MQAKIEKYLKELEEKNNELLQREVWKEKPLPEWAKYVFGADFGKTYIRIWHANKHDAELKHKSCFCFVDYDGNLYKSAGWKAPAKGIRGTLDNPLYFSNQFYR